jgi:ribosomal protein L16 Arg81 hydroxylase
MKKAFKVKFDSLKKKNLQCTKDACNKLLDQCFAQSIKPKVMQGLYASISDLRFDLEQLRTEFLQKFAQGISIKEYLYEYLFTKSLSLIEDLVTNQTTTQANQIRMLSEKLKSAESEAISYKSDLNNEKENCFKRLQESESDRIKFKTENTLLTERYTAAKYEIDELRMKLSCEFSEKLAELES